jgi:hypothetical protein
MTQRSRNASVFNPKILAIFERICARPSDLPPIQLTSRRGSLIHLRQQLYSCRKLMAEQGHPLANDALSISMHLDPKSGNKDEPATLTFTSDLFLGDDPLNEQIDQLIEGTPDAGHRTAEPPRPAPLREISTGRTDPAPGSSLASTLAGMGFSASPDNIQLADPTDPDSSN